MISVSPFARRIIMKPPPPMLPALGQVTARARPTATAASIALPPRCMISTPTREAISLVEATIPCRARAGSRDAACCVIGTDATNRRINITAQARFFIFSPYRKLVWASLGAQAHCLRLLAPPGRQGCLRSQASGTFPYTTRSTAARRTELLFQPDQEIPQTGSAFSYYHRE